MSTEPRSARPKAAAVAEVSEDRDSAGRCQKRHCQTRVVGRSRGENRQGDSGRMELEFRETAERQDAVITALEKKKRYLEAEVHRLNVYFPQMEARLNQKQSIPEDNLKIWE
ncbi:hypothetical protein OUZ56_021894 [Daphnia magna]|uniref:Uncharacterized protein n=1 Tax=Daphnia magna TaxID=35525 RepID=A0ABR0AUV7_9CRUS|nr:hypothetical protein OUZ56_021894 [Daphnia magna]